MGAPEATTAPAPLKTPTIAPTRPGEKKRRGPFQKPKTKPKNIIDIDIIRIDNEAPQ